MQVHSFGTRVSQLRSRYLGLWVFSQECWSLISSRRIKMAKRQRRDQYHPLINLVPAGLNGRTRISTSLNLSPEASSTIILCPVDVTHPSQYGCYKILQCPIIVQTLFHYQKCHRILTFVWEPSTFVLFVCLVLVRGLDVDIRKMIWNLTCEDSVVCLILSAQVYDKGDFPCL